MSAFIRQNFPFFTRFPSRAPNFISTFLGFFEAVGAPLSDRTEMKMCKLVAFD